MLIYARFCTNTKGAVIFPLSCSLLFGMSESEDLVCEMSDPESSAEMDEKEALGTEEVQEFERFIEQLGLE